MNDVLCSPEVEFFVETLVPQKLDDVGTRRWLEFHQRLQKLNQQAIVEAAALKEEYVKETFVTLKKVPVLINEVILINLWKQRVLPTLLAFEPNPQCTFVAYSVLFHEAICVGLLEVMLYHAGCYESIEDCAADLLDYAYDSAAQLLVIELSDVHVGEKGAQEIVRQQADLAFDIGIRCLSIIRYMGENLDKVSLSVSTRIYNIHDAPMLLVELILKKPWRRNGKHYNRGKWTEFESEAVGQAEAQVWLTLRQLLLDPVCSSNYAITESRRNHFSKLLPLMQPALLDQIPPLVDFNHWLCRLTMSGQPAAANRPLLLEPLLDIKEGILRQGEKRWKKLAKEQLRNIFPTDRQTLMEIATGLSQSYNTDVLEQFESQKKETCSLCGNSAVQRCSRCKSKWYCSRKCQVSDWDAHKDECTPIES